MNKTKRFFDKKSKTWDEKETHNQEYFKAFIHEYIPIKEGMKVLDLACGTGVLSNAIFEVTKTDVLGLDISSGMIKQAKKKNKTPQIKFKRKDFYKSKLKDFDAIIVHNAYPHFLNKEAFKERCYQTLKGNGLLIIAHSIGKETVNGIHKKPGIIKSNILLNAVDESSFYKDKFEIISLVDVSDAYVIVLKKMA